MTEPHLWLPYTQMATAPPALEVVGAEGHLLHLADGRTLVDGVSNWWTACHGHRHPVVVNAVQQQLHALPHLMLGGLVHRPARELARRLAALCPGDLDRVFFTDSGSVAVEVAMKVALQSWRNRGQPGRSRFLCFRGGYHGDTLGAMSVCDPEEGMHSLFSGALLPQLLADVPEGPAAQAATAALLEAHAPTLAGVIIEPLVQGAGGMRFHSAAALRWLREACDHHGLPLIFDEIMTGFGRVGPMLACEEAGVVPDVLTLAKALTGGTLPLAATVVSDRLFQTFLGDDPGLALMHGPTFMGNPLGCAAALASLDLFAQEPRLQQVQAIEAALRAGLERARGLPGVVDVRARGAVGVIQVDRVDPAWGPAFVARGLWLRPFGDIVYCAPPFTTPPDAIAALADGMVDVVAGRR